MSKTTNPLGRLTLWGKVSLAIASVSIAGATIAQVAFPSRGIEEAADSETMQLPLSTPKAYSGNVSNLLSPLSNPTLLDFGTLTPVREENGRTSKAPAVKADGDLTGKWVITYKTLISNGSDSGGTATIETGATPTEFVVKNFWGNLEVHGTIDTAAGTITIPNQIVATNNAGVKIDITAINTSNGNADRKTPITGHINADGTISIDTWWALYDASKDK